MRIGAGLVGHHRNHGTGNGNVGGHKVGYITHSKVIKKRRCVKKLKRRSPPHSAALQELFGACRDIFKGPGTVPPPEDVRRLSRILDDMKPEDVGLSGELQFFKTKNGIKGTPRVIYTTIFKCNNFSLCSMHIKSYDWADPDSSTALSQLRLANVKADGIFTAPCNSSVLYPTTGGNIHAFTALTPCAILDVLGPPYSNKDGRDCSYYKDFPYNTFSSSETYPGGEEGKAYGWLEEIDVPENSQMDWIEYLGPQIMETGC